MDQSAIEHPVSELWLSNHSSANHGRRSLSRKRPGCPGVLEIYVIALMLITCGTTFAQDHFRIDPDRSEVHFLLGGTGHDAHGAFHISSGDITFYRKTGEMQGTVSVDAGSGNSDNSSRDKKMTNDELKAQMFPWITFAPTRFTGSLKDAGDSTVQVEGTSTL